MQTNPEEDAPQIVHAPGGLFPVPVKPSERNAEALKKTYDMFQFMGCFVAKALLDSRILDMPFSNAFYKWMLGQVRVEYYESTSFILNHIPLILGTLLERS